MKCCHLTQANAMIANDMFTLMLNGDHLMTRMHVSKPWYISVHSTIDEPFWLNTNIRHILVSLALIGFMHYYSPLISLVLFSY